jgi:hypothetical protein
MSKVKPVLAVRVHTCIIIPTKTSELTSVPDIQMSGDIAVITWR